ncbi:MFS transporter [Rhodococcoides kyotonense]|uniref:Major Facilitator Superfamily protein n=1 Tax=Rhodococcoides kyotonense TaxID=398843 RepID=A0A239M476_9NOCA|nr:MFS transporter [Rhodococcus kyotonensis]SNT36923.1 Major Facilitator Superfamily protein [Rhodococcus kyotonensis]
MPSPSSGLGGAVAGNFRGAGWTPRIVFSLLSIVFLIEAVTLAYTTATTALPYISAEFQTTQAGWILTAYALTGTIAAPIFGKLADRYGKRRMLLTVLFLSFCGSLISASAQSFGMLLVGRTFEGFLIASMFLSYSLIRDVYPAKIVPFAASITVTGAGALAALLPTIVGQCIDNWGFRSVFVLSAVWVGSMALFISITTKETEVRTKSRIDVLGAFLIAAAIGGTLTGISLGNTWGWSDPRTLGLIIGGLSLGVGFVLSALKRPEPILDVRMFRRRGILIASAVAAVGYGIQPVTITLASIIGLTPAVMGGGYGLGLSATALAQITTPSSVSAVLAGIITGLFVRRVGPWNIGRAGVLFLALGTAYVAMRHDNVVDMIVGFVLIGFGAGFVAASIPNLVISAAPVHEQASFSSGVQVVLSGVGAVTPVLAFVVLGRSAFAGPGGVPVYSNGAITAIFVACLALAIVGLIVLSTVLRPRAESFAPTDVLDAAQLELLEAELASVDKDISGIEGGLVGSAGADAPKSAIRHSAPSLGMDEPR